MGVEYRHFFISADPTYLPDKNVIKRVDVLLDKWRLRSGKPKIINLGNGTNESINQPLETIDFGNGIAVHYPDVDGAQAKDIFGPSYYPGMEDEDRYIQDIIFITGSDYRIHPSSQEIYLEVVRPALEKEMVVDAYDEQEYEAYYGLYAQVYPSSLSTTPPQVKIKSVDKKRLIGDQPFLGFWRTALIMECGKDLPKLGDDLFVIENIAFLQELEQAIGCKLVQIGEVY